jgi:hypothetical protein
VDDARIAELTAEVLADLRTPTVRPQAPGTPSSLEARVAALENVVRTLHQAPLAGPIVVSVATAPERPSHPSLQLLGPAGGGDRCLLEPDKPCVGSGQCRTFGH